MKNKKVPELRFKGFDEEWEERKLGEEVHIYDGTHQTPKYKKQGVMFLSVENIKTLKSNKFISIEAFNKEFKDFPQKGDILMTRIGDVGTTNVVYHDEKLAYYVSLALLKPKVIESYFLSTLINSPSVQNEIWQRTLHVAFPKKINKNEIEKIKINIPIYGEQIQIAKFFTQLDKKIDLQQQELNNLKQMKQGFLQKMFPKEGETIPEIRFPGFTEEWEYTRLAKISNVYDGTHQTPKYKDNGIMFLSVENINDLKSNKFISHEAFEEEFKVYPENGDILMTRIGDIGTANVVLTDEKIAYYVSLALLKPKIINSNFLLSLISSPFVQNEIWKRTLHVAFPKKINKNEIERIELFIPSKEEQTLIGNFFKHLDDTIALHQQELELLKQTKKAFLQKMFI